MNKPRHKIRKNFLPLLLAVVGVVTGDSVSFAAVAFDADFSAYNVGTLNGQNSWVKSGALTNEIAVIAASGGVPQSMKFTGSATAAPSYRELTTAFNPYGVTSQTTFYYAIENFRVNQAMTGGTGVCNFTVSAGGAGSYLDRLYVRRFGGLAGNTSTFDLGINATGTGVVYGTTAFSINTSYKIVVAYVANPTGTSDVVKVYVNPVGQDPATWTPEVTQSATEPTSATSNTFKSFMITPASVSASTQNGLTMGRIIVGDTVSDVLPVPTVPTSSAATSSSLGGFTANWVASAGATGYYLDVATDSGFTSFLSGYNGKDVGAVTSYSVTGTFSAGATLYYRVRAYNSNGASLSSAQQQVTIIDVPVVLVPTVTNNSTNGTVTWTSGPGWTPNNPISDTNATVTFSGVLGGALTANNDSTGNFRLNSLVFTNTGSGNLNLTGNPLQFVTSGGTNPTLVFATTATVLQSIGNNLQIDAELTLLQASQVASNSTVAGVISGSGGISKTGTGYAYITGVNNSFGGPVKVSAGVLGATTFGLSGQNSSLGTNGTIYLGDSGATSQLRGTQSAEQTSDKTILVGGSGTFNYIENYGTAGTALTLSGNIETSTNGAKSLRLNPKNGPMVVSGTIGGNMPDNQLSLMLTNGTNQLTLIRSNAYNGGTYLQGGALALSNSYALGTGAVNLYGVTITALTNVNLANNFQFAAAGVTAQITATTKVDMTNKISGNIAGFMGVEGTIRINTSFATAYLANPTNTFNSVLITQGAIAADSLGVPGSPSPLGTNGTITFGNGGVSILKYLGSGETNSKTLAFSAGASQWSILEHRGTGPLKLTSPLQIDRTSANTLILESQLTGSGELAASITNAAGVDIALNGTRLTKSGPGDWILSASNDFRNTSVQEGKLVARDANALPANRDVEMAGGTLLANYSGTGATLGNLCLTNFKSSPNRYINTAVVPETYKFTNSTIDLGTNRSSTMVFSSATNWITNQSANSGIAETYGPTQYLKVANSSTGGKLYITNTNGVPLSRIVRAENTNDTAMIRSTGEIYFNPIQSNTAPMITLSQSFALNENVSLATVVGTVVATDADANSTLSGWTIVSGNTGSAFAINAATGQISVAGALNYEGTPSYSLGVTVSDGTATSAVGTVIVTVTNVAEYSDVFGSSSPTADDNGDGISNLMAYALGAASPSSLVVPPALNTTDSTKLTITALIRINDPKLSVVGEYGLTLGTWVKDSPIAGVDSSSQTGAVAGVTKRQDFSVDRGTDPKKFIHLQATLAP